MKACPERPHCSDGILFVVLTIQLCLLSAEPAIEFFHLIELGLSLMLVAMLTAYTMQKIWIAACPIVEMKTAG